jgi:dihydrolipoamide dehydrogenase
MKNLDVAIVGAGTAGLFAAASVSRKTENFLLFEGGPLGTTCARVGCMPSKGFIHAANAVFASRDPRVPGVPVRPDLPVDTGKLLGHVRALRDGLASGVAARVEKRFSEKLVRENVSFAGPMTLSGPSGTYACKAIVLATGSEPQVPPGFSLEPATIVTTDGFFELRQIPAGVLVVGMGPVGIELGQALARLGASVTAVEMTASSAGISDPGIEAFFKKILESEKNLSCRFRTSARLVNAGKRPRVVLENLETGTKEEGRWDLILLVSGRRPRVAGLHLENSGLATDGRGFPVIDPKTLRCKDMDVFFAGDASGLRPFYHDAQEQGVLAGKNASDPKNPSGLVSRIPLTIVFTRPNVAAVGTRFSNLEPGGFVTGEADFDTSGRGILECGKKGLLHIFVDKKTGKIAGAEMAAEAGEHISHLLAAIIHAGLDVEGALSIPYYHPTYEEGVQGALQDAKRKLTAGTAS